MRYETSETIVLDGKKLPIFDINVVKLYVESKKPSLIGKNYHIELSTQRV